MGVTPLEIDKSYQKAVTAILNLTATNKAIAAIPKYSNNESKHGYTQHKKPNDIKNIKELKDEWMLEIFNLAKFYLEYPKKVDTQHANKCQELHDKYIYSLELKIREDLKDGTKTFYVYMAYASILKKVWKRKKEAYDTMEKKYGDSPTYEQKRELRHQAVSVLVAKDSYTIANKLTNEIINHLQQKDSVQFINTINGNNSDEETLSSSESCSSISLNDSCSSFTDLMSSTNNNLIQNNTISANWPFSKQGYENRKEFYKNMSSKKAYD